MVKKMKISTKSWHYKLRDMYNTEPQRGLCKYFWQTVLLVLGLPFFGMYKLFIKLPVYVKFALLFIYSFSSVVFFWYSLVYQEEPNIYFLFLLPFVMLGVLFAFVLITWLIVELEQKIKSKDNNKISLVKEYIKAKKQKICPILEFVDDEEKKVN